MKTHNNNNNNNSNCEKQDKFDTHTEKNAEERGESEDPAALPPWHRKPFESPASFRWHSKKHISHATG